MPRPKNVKAGEIFVQTPVKVKSDNTILICVPYNNGDGVRQEQSFVVFFNQTTGKPDVRSKD